MVCKGKVNLDIMFNIFGCYNVLNVVVVIVVVIEDDICDEVILCVMVNM